LCDGNSGSIRAYLFNYQQKGTAMTERPAYSDRRVIDRHLFVPHYLAVLANSLTWSQSLFYREKYGIGVNEVRIVTVLAHSPGLSARGLTEVLVMNKAIVSKSLAMLVEKGLIEEDQSVRPRPYFLAPSGVELNSRIVRVALERERRLLNGFTANDKTILLGYLARMFHNLDTTIDPSQMAADARDDPDDA
jgi:DNA-binding MarR family transcriptional regulator